MTRLEHAIKDFADDAFGSRDVPSRFRKLGEEIGELGEAIARYTGEKSRPHHQAVCLEAADVAIVLADLLIVLGGESLAGWSAVKMDRNRERLVAGAR